MTSETMTGAKLLSQHGLYVLRVHRPIWSDSGVRCSCSKGASCTSIGKHPVDQGWGKSATNDPEMMTDWFAGKQWNMGIVLGLCHGIDPSVAVVDIENDTEEGGVIAEQMLGDYPTVSWTSNKSTHRLYRWHPGLPDVANVTINGLEVRIGGAGKETQSIAPPSQHENGRYYEWVPGRQLGDTEIADLPDSFVQWVNENYTQEQSSGGGLSNHAAFRKVREKVHSPGRNNAMLRFANSVWREIWQLHGINSFDDPQIEQDVIVRLLGANLVTCEPPLPEQEIETIYRNSKKFMFGELRRESVQKQQQIMEMSAPPATEDSEDSEVDDRQFGQFLSAVGVRLENDPRYDPAEECADRINQWVCDWQLSYLRMTERGSHVLRLCDTEVYLTEAELDRAVTVARKVFVATGGRIRLDRTFPYWTWKEIWMGRSTKKNGITRGLREYVENRANTEDSGDSGLQGTIAEAIHGLVGSPQQIAAVFQNRPERVVLDLKEIELVERLKIGPGNQLVAQWQDGDPNSGVYVWKNELWVIVGMMELSQKYGSSFGRNANVGTKEMSDAMIALGYEKKEFKRGRVSGRRWIKKVEVSIDE